MIGEPLTCAVLGNAGESAGRHVLQQREVGRERFITATLSAVSRSSDFLSLGPAVGEARRQRTRSPPRARHLAEPLQEPRLPARLRREPG